MTQTYMTPAKVWRNVAVLAFAQAVLGAQMTMQFIAGGLVGQVLTPWACIATLPISMMILGSTLSARPLARFMARHGRQMGFTLAAAMGALGGLVSFIGIYLGSFWVYVAGTTLSGTYMAAQGFFRFAAVDGAEPALHGKAISAVMAGGLVAGVLGPWLTNISREMLGITYLGTYALIVAVNVIGPPLFALLRPAPRLPAPAGGKAQAQIRLRDVFSRPRIVVAMVCATVSYALMNLVMTSTPLAMMGCGLTSTDTSFVVGAHVLAMYLPSFFTGHLIERFGTTRIVATGMAILSAAGLIALTGVQIEHFTVTLILLGLGWNFGYIGATAMLTRAQRPHEREALQGLNDSIVFGGVFVASLASGGLLNCSGSTAQAGWNLVNLAMLPFLALAGAALVWLTIRRRQDA